MYFLYFGTDWDEVVLWGVTEVCVRFASAEKSILKVHFIHFVAQDKHDKLISL